MTPTVFCFVCFVVSEMALGCYWAPVETECLTMRHCVTTRSKSLSLISRTAAGHIEVTSVKLSIAGLEVMQWLEQGVPFNVPASSAAHLQTSPQRWPQEGPVPRCQEENMKPCHSMQVTAPAGFLQSLVPVDE